MVDLLTALGVPNPDNGITYATGMDGYPAFSLTPYAKFTPKPASTYFKDTTYSDFAITLTFKLKSSEGVLFAVLNPYGNVMQLAVKIEPHITPNFHNLALYYTPYSSSTPVRRSVRISNFVVSGLERKWVKIGLKVKGDTVSLYKNCEFVGSEMVDRSRLEFEPGSSLYLGSGGSVIRGQFVVSGLFHFMVIPYPYRANQNCSRRLSFFFSTFIFQRD